MSDLVLPFYLVCDESYSMGEYLEVLNSGLRELHYAIGTDPVVAERTRFCLIGFSSTAEVLWPLKRLSESSRISQLSPKSATCYGTAFTLLRETIEEDVDALQRDGHRVCRPAVFFLSDGQPTDPDYWPTAYDWLTDRSWPVRPQVVALGIGDAEAAVIGRIGTFKAFTSTRTTTPTALRGIARALITAMIRSSTLIAERGDANDGSDDCYRSALLLPGHVVGFTPVDTGTALAGSTPNPSPIHPPDAGS